MIDSPVWMLLTLLAAHWVGDFLLQTHWQASNKSKRFDALAAHVATYSITLLAATILLWGITAEVAYTFAVVNAIAHLFTDWLTSKITSQLFGAAMRDTFAAQEFAKYGPDGEYGRLILSAARHWHNFFVVIGFDQLIHHACLAYTLWIVLRFGGVQ